MRRRTRVQQLHENRAGSVGLAAASHKVGVVIGVVILVTAGALIGAAWRRPWSHAHGAARHAGELLADGDSDGCASGTATPSVSWLKPAWMLHDERRVWLGMLPRGRALWLRWMMQKVLGRVVGSCACDAQLANAQFMHAGCGKELARTRYIRSLLPFSSQCQGMPKMVLANERRIRTRDIAVVILQSPADYVLSLLGQMAPQGSEAAHVDLGQIDPDWLGRVELVYKAFVSFWLDRAHELPYARVELIPAEMLLPLTKEPSNGTGQASEKLAGADEDITDPHAGDNWNLEPHEQGWMELLSALRGQPEDRTKPRNAKDVEVSEALSKQARDADSALGTVSTSDVRQVGMNVPHARALSRIRCAIDAHHSEQLPTAHAYDIEILIRSARFGGGAAPSPLAWDLLNNSLVDRLSRFMHPKLCQQWVKHGIERRVTQLRRLGCVPSLQNSDT
ncbi:hypothetical protein FVE85_5727 [Porphyridium purpureum]|uniref:Uncharacterized protein n=1 Tax=Porphyridium purpureum TaxID=35688 RepID=A0A5J4Z4Q6_PORPP|nr:hypothetical protein FVE85_5727 [Porphyridium purpureum]|eukprot:POR8606..scf295_1